LLQFVATVDSSQLQRLSVSRSSFHLAKSVETAAYLTVIEAIANAVERKAKVVSVNLAREDKQLVVQIKDDAAGGGSEPLHLADRVGALGGSLEVGPHSLRAEIPCE